VTEQEILDILREEKPYLKEQFGLLSVGLFGSHAKGTQGPESDVGFRNTLVHGYMDVDRTISLNFGPILHP
jgi:predicted nucleotidyltransferase